MHLPTTTRATVLFAVALICCCGISRTSCGEENNSIDAKVLKLVQHGFAENDGVRIHYVEAGEGTPLIFLHGFPDYWYTWRSQIATLAADHRVIALDLRGYNQSDKPAEVKDYAMPTLMSDVTAVMDHLQIDKATIIGNDWGGAIAWYLAIFKPQQVERLVVCNLPHPNGFSRELRKIPLSKRAANMPTSFKKTMPPDN